MTARVFIAPTGTYSPSMLRVARALGKRAPEGVLIVPTLNLSDVVLLHTIGHDAMERAREIKESGRRYIVAQYCCGDRSPWSEFWKQAEFVWSYYDLTKEAEECGFNFYNSPLGIDEAFLADPIEPVERRNLILTSGHVSSSQSEPIEEVWKAAEILGIEAIHIGPNRVAGMKYYPPNWRSVGGVSDHVLAHLNRQAAWVSAMRHVEGFEMPAIEGLACGAKPIVFRQDSTQYWYGDIGSVMFIEESSGNALVESLISAIQRTKILTRIDEREIVLQRFNWDSICAGFWERLQSSLEVAA